MALCRQHVVTGRPVASAALQHAGLEWSSATIRNELGALERAGLVHKPHSASGRVPTPEGWRIYVETLPRGDARPEHQRLVDVSLGETADPSEPMRSVGAGLRSTARVLSELSGCVAIGFVGQIRSGVIRALELVPLTGGAEDSGRLLVMIGLEDGSSSVRTVEVGRELLTRQGDLRRLQELLRELTVGRSLEQARQRLSGYIEAQEQRVDRLVAEALRIGLLLCVASFEPLVMQVAGQGSLLAGEGGESTAAELLELLEDYQRVAEILCQLLPDTHHDPRASIRVDLVGSGVGLGALGLRGHGGAALGVEGRLGGLTLVGCRLRWSGRDGGPGWSRPDGFGRDGASGSDGTTAAVALLGSPRMDFEAVIPLVEYAARAMAARG
jgi:heat-inducible transcriptional repressor